MKNNIYFNKKNINENNIKIKFYEKKKKFKRTKFI